MGHHFEQRTRDVTHMSNMACINSECASNVNIPKTVFTVLLQQL